ncbi:MAG: hypothetical protein LBC33_02230, partial [Mycoplasmataceae bacterium]|nr:hypothetical protein [Mycoplasmataceae bacterium]
SFPTRRSSDLDQKRYLQAKHYLNENQKIELINDDAFLYEPTQKFDLIFIDGPKSHQEKLIMHYAQFLKPSGLIVIDNMYLKKITESAQMTKQKKGLIKKIGDFRKWLKQNYPDQFSIIDIEDGIGIIRF